MIGQLGTRGRKIAARRSVELWSKRGGGHQPTSPRSGLVLFVSGASPLCDRVRPTRWFTSGLWHGIAAVGGAADLFVKGMGDPGSSSSIRFNLCLASSRARCPPCGVE